MINNLALLLGIIFWAMGFATIGCAIALSKEHNYFNEDEIRGDRYE